MPGPELASGTVADRIERIPDPAEPLPTAAWPTLGLFVFGLGLWTGSTLLAVSGDWPLPLAVLANWLAMYLLFTVSHDAAHHSASSRPWLNRWLGRIATFFVGPIGFPIWRFVHMQHHRFVNVAGADPDYGSSHASGWRRPLRWMSLDLDYLRFYLPRLPTRPRCEKIEMAVTVAIYLALAGIAVAFGLGLWFLLLVLLPARLNGLTLGWAFDYLPHCRLHAEAETGRLRATRNRVGLEWLMAPLALYQNYHLVHHLHPVIPFYRYLAVWRRNEEGYLEGDPALTRLSGRPLTAAEYRRLRRLDH